MERISSSQMIIFHHKITEKTGGSSRIRDRSLIESALNKALQTFDGKELYLDDLKKISVITYSLINNHGFVDGNKRIGVAMMLLFLQINGIKVKYTQQELIDLGLGIAAGKLKEEHIEDWIKRHR
jgi:death-on-curing protein